MKTLLVRLAACLLLLSVLPILFALTLYGFAFYAMGPATFFSLVAFIVGGWIVFCIGSLIRMIGGF